MQSLRVYSIRDAKAEVYNQPWFAKTHGEAERNFAQLARDPKSMVGQFPEDYDLYFIGSYNDQTGVIDALETPQHIAKAISLNAPEARPHAV